MDKYLICQQYLYKDHFPLSKHHPSPPWIFVALYLSVDIMLKQNYKHTDCQHRDQTTNNYFDQKMPLL